ncbi:MAG: hypothetical protein ACI9JN_001888 [Bacteroidia bacterium]|jgi:hypothetical protein
MRNKHILFSIIVVTTLCTSCTNRGNDPYRGYQLSGQSAPLDMVFIEGQSNIPSFYIGRSEEPNINYVAYLSWLKNVFVDYPEIYEDAKIKYNKGSTTTRFNDPSLVYHMEHPAFAYYPIVGATWHQIQSYMVWKTDRLNEDILIQTGLYNEDFNQLNEENFNTESYLYGQYTGDFNKRIVEDRSHKISRSVRWEDGILFGGYRLPTEAEWELLTNESNENINKSNYPYGKNYPFFRWLRPDFGMDDESFGMVDYRYFLNKEKPVKASIESYKNGIQGPYLTNKPSNVSGNVKEWLMDVYHDSAVTDWNNLSEYFYKIGFETRSERQFGVYDMDGIIDLKDSMGRLRFRILGVNSDGTPLWALHPKRRGVIQLKSYDTVRTYINPSDYYLESNVDTVYNHFKTSFRHMYLYYKQLNVQLNVGGQITYNTEDMKLNFLLQNALRYDYVYNKTIIPNLYTVEDIDREVYHWVNRIWTREMIKGKCGINIIDFSSYYCNDTGMYSAHLIPKYAVVENDAHQQYKLIRGGTWEKPDFANREFMLADSGRSDVGFRVLLPYTNMPVKDKYKVKWK